MVYKSTNAARPFLKLPVQQPVCFDTLVVSNDLLLSKGI